MIIPSWLSRFETQPAKVDVLGEVGQRRRDPARLAWDISTGLKESIRRLDLTQVRPSELMKVAAALRKEGLMSVNAYGQFRNATLNEKGQPRADAPFNFLREVQAGAREAKALARSVGDLSPEKVYAEFVMSARGLNHLAGVIKGVRVVDLRV
jgi:hypothetical protein